MIVFEPLDDLRCFIVRAGDSLDDADLRNYVETVRELPEAAAFDALYDFSRVERISGLSVKMVRTLSLVRACDPALAAKQRVAIVVRSNALFAMGRMLQSLMRARGPQIGVFRMLPDAAAFLGVPEAVVAGTDPEPAPAR